MERNGAQILVDTLIEQGVDTVFGYPGGTVLNIFDALYDRRDTIRVIIPAHEQGGAHAADAYARVSGKTGVVLATSGPGATNLVTGIANAYMDSTPMVAITGNVSLGLIGRDSFQEVDICGVTMPVTKHNYIVQDLSRLADTLREAFVIARAGRPGPVLVDIPKDITAAVTETAGAVPTQTRPLEPPPQSLLRGAAELLAKSRRPLLLCGGGVASSCAETELRALAEKTGVPVAVTLMGLGLLPAEHPLMLGMIGMHGTPCANYAGEHCDLLICAGTRFSDRVAGDRNRFAPHAKLIHIDIDPSEFDKNVVCDLHIHGNARTVLEGLLAVCAARGDTDWQSEILHFKAKHPMPEGDDDKPFNPRAALRAMRELAGEDAIIVTDVGQHQMWTAQHYPFERPRSLVTSGGLGAMGFGLGAAIGAKAAAPERPVVLVTGDGSFHMNLAELSTSVTEKLPVTVVVMNNGVLGMVRQWQSMFYDGRYMGTTTGRPTRFAKLCEAFGGLGCEADNLTAFREAFAAALASGQTALIDCHVHPDEKVFPMIPPGKSGRDILYTE